MDFIELKSGSSVEDDKIEAFKTEGRFSKYIYLMAGVHGDEVEGVYVVKNLFNWLKEDHDIELPLVILPVLNIDGYRVTTRRNSHGVDLNRNLPADKWSSEYEEDKYNPGTAPLSEPENVFLTKLMDKYTPGIIISIHSWKPMLNFNGDCKEVAAFLNKFNKYPVEATVGYETPGSLGEYAPEKYKSPVLTYELPKISDDLTLKDIWEANEEGLKELLASAELKKYL